MFYTTIRETEKKFTLTRFYFKSHPLGWERSPLFSLNNWSYLQNENIAIFDALSDERVQEKMTDKLKIVFFLLLSVCSGNRVDILKPITNELCSRPHKQALRLVSDGLRDSVDSFRLEHAILCNCDCFDAIFNDPAKIG